LLIGDSPQGMVSDITPAEMTTYFANRAGYGFNCVQVHLLSGATFGGNSTTFAAEDGTTPFTTTGDISTPREAFFSQIDDLLNLAHTYGIYVMLTAAETIDALTLFKNNGNTKCTNFGAYLGARYSQFPNVIWCVGNDFQDWNSDADARNAILAVCNGILSQDSNHLLTAWLDYDVSASRDSTDFNGVITLDFVYTYYCTYDYCLNEYALNPAKPLFMGEANYEGEDLKGYTTTPLIVRKQAYWSLLSGACGTFYCNDAIWSFDTGWASSLDSYSGPGHMQILRNLFEAYNWHLLIPDTAHDYLTAGYGTYETGNTVNTNVYSTCAYISDGSLALIYMPNNRTMTVDMSQFSSTVTARWFDPTDGSYTADAASPLSNSGTHDFSRATTNNDGDADWVLVLEV